VKKLVMKESVDTELKREDIDVVEGRKAFS
jgi:hypothetical protein